MQLTPSPPAAAGAVRYSPSSLACALSECQPSSPHLASEGRAPRRRPSHKLPAAIESRSHVCSVARTVRLIEEYASHRATAASAAVWLLCGLAVLRHSARGLY